MKTTPLVLKKPISEQRPLPTEHAQGTVPLNQDETCEDQWGKRVIKHSCKSTDSCCSKCVYHMIAKVC